MTDLYRFHDTAGELLYVGITDRGPRRWREHMAEKQWWPDVARVDLEHYPDRAAAMVAERTAIINEHPLHNIVHAASRRAAVTDRSSTMNRLDKAEGSFDTDSLVGSFFHSDHRRGWQGVVVAEPAPGVYLVETFSWMMGESFEQRLVKLRDMTEWVFYDDSEWMRNNSDRVQSRWERERIAEEGDSPSRNTPFSTYSDVTQQREPKMPAVPPPGHESGRSSRTYSPSSSDLLRGHGREVPL